ncbi:MAG: MMPL family transporter [Deltaproteobacteria bacterium]|nr:MMPL family transporter [Deltaproteobacteria bacterium]
MVRRRAGILLTSIAIAVGAALLALRLPVHTDFSSLLPPSAPSVQALRKLEKRARVVSTLILVVESDDPDLRRAAARELNRRVKELPPDLITKVRFDDRVLRDFVWKNRWLFPSLDELKTARDELSTRIKQAKLKENPLYIDLDDEAPVIRSSDGELDRRLAEARRAYEATGELISADGRVQSIVMYSANRSGDGVRNAHMLDELHRIVDEVRAGLPPGVEIGLAGDAVINAAERAAILDGMVIAIAVTILLVLLVQILFFKSWIAVGSLMWSLVVGTLTTFAFTRLTIGELNIATAFLSSIVVGNGINFGIVVSARYFEERRAGTQPDAAMERTLRHTFTGTLAAALTAAVAYGSLLVTDFRGFRHFGVIGGAGMIACWIAAFTVLPATLAAVDRRGWLRPRKEPAIGRFLQRLVPRHLAPVAVGLLVVIVATGVETWRYFATDPFEDNFRNLRSQSAAAREEARWMKLSNHSFGRGMSAGFVMAVEDRARVPGLVARVRAVDEGKPPKERLFASITSLDDVLPQDQPAKLAVLAEIRELLTPEVLDALSEQDQQLARDLHPPADLRALVEADLPNELVEAFTEADGSRGRLVFAVSGSGFNTWSSQHILAFAERVRALDLGDDVVMGSEAFVFADVLGTIQRDGPRATFAALAGAILVVIVILGWSRGALVTLVCAGAGTIAMLAVVSLMGIKINFLDFVALPLTVGIGIDYAVNIVAREREEGDARAALGTVGGAVVLASATTIIGYGSLTLSQNLAIRSFGLAAIVGEITCLCIAVVGVPALSHFFRRRRRAAQVSAAAQGDA